MQCNNQWILFVFADLGGNEQGIRKLLVGVLEQIGPLLNARIDRAADASATRSLRTGGVCRRLLIGLLRKVNLSRGYVEAKGHRNNQPRSHRTSRHGLLL
jgi:hypothetical protein